MIFLDTNILLYAVTSAPAEEAKRRRAIAVIAGGDYATSGQVHAEFFYNATMKIKPPLTAAEALEWLTRLRRFPVVPVTGELVARGAANAERHQISYWDGAIIAAAQEIGADTLYSEDLNHGQRYGSVRVVNPFAA